MTEIIPRSVKELHRIFEARGKKLYLVGGCVRDFLMDEKPKDFDLATDALPDEVISMIGNKYRTNLQGKAFGVVVVYTEDQPEGMEIATFRQDVSKGRNPEVKLGVTIEDDVKRRDLTYNSMFFDLDTNEIVDLVGGREDLIDRKITKMVGDPMERFEEDSLRILRAFRFASRYGHPLDKETEDAIRKRNQLENPDPETGDIKRISQERIWEEIKKAWKQAKDFDQYLSFFTKFDMWEQLFPGVEINTKHTGSKDFDVVIANLFRKADRIGLDKKMVQDLKIDIDTARKSIFLIDLQILSPENVLDMYRRKVQTTLTDDTILEWIDTMISNRETVIKFTEYVPTVSAQKLMDEGYSKKELGVKIKELEAESFRRMLD